RPKALTVQKQLHPVRVAVAPDGDRLALFPRPVPVRQQLDQRPGPPPGLVVEEVVLREAADVHDPEVGVDAGPAVGCRLALVVEAGPDEPPRYEGAPGERLPTGLSGRAPRGTVQVVGADVAALAVVRI